MPKINIGIEEGKRKEIAEGLARVLADSYTLYLKTHNFHWNVTGRMFHTLHLVFENQYKNLAEAVDLLAERIRALGFYSPGSYSEFGRLTSIRESLSVPEVQSMIRELVEDQEAVIRSARIVFLVAEREGDQATANLLAERIQYHEKTAWMLRSTIEDGGLSLIHKVAS